MRNAEGKKEISPRFAKQYAQKKIEKRTAESRKKLFVRKQWTRRQKPKAKAVKGKSGKRACYKKKGERVSKLM